MAKAKLAKWGMVGGKSNGQAARRGRE